MSTPEPHALRHRVRIAALLLALTACVADAQTGFGPGAVPGRGPGLGQPLDGEALRALAGRSIYPDGRGLPPGQGTARAGLAVYAQHCRSCHGEAGRGGSGGALISGEPLRGPDPDPAVDNYWPYATTLFDFTRRAMPMDAPGSLADADVYAVTAYLLSLGGIIGEDDVLDAASLPRVRMPNRDGFIGIDAASGTDNEKRITKPRRGG